MKSKLLLLILPIFIFIQGCKKETITNPVEVITPAKPFVEEARVFLASKYTSGSLTDLAVDASTLYKLDSGRYIIRVPLKTEGTRNFILLTADSVRGIKKGVLLNVVKTSAYNGEKFSGTITIKELNGTVKEVRKIVDGFRVSNNPFAKEEYKVLPEVVITVVRSTESVSWVDWYNLLSLTGSSTTSGWYGFNDTYGGGGSTGNTYVPPTNTILINFDEITTEPIDLLKYLNCFDLIQNLGATYTIKICAQLPVDNNSFYILEDFATGHAFLSVTKTNGNASITQNFGFYPENGPKSMALLPVPSKIVNNQFTKYNASLTVTNVSYSQFSNFMHTALTLSNQNYDLNNYNCTDYALDCFNSIRGNNDMLIVPDHIYNGINYKTTPNKLYDLLENKKNNGDPEASKIEIGVNNSKFSYGSCN